MTIPELIKQGVSHITTPHWTVGHIEVGMRDGRMWMMIIENETGRKYLPERGFKKYYLEFDNYEEYTE